jgi:integrase
MAKLTKRIIDASLPKQKDYIIWDDEIKGFGCRILPTGRKTYVFFYRSPVNQKFSYLKIGVHGSITVDIARDEVLQLTALLARKIDPKENQLKQKEELKQSILFEDFWQIFREKYIKINHKLSTQKRDFYRIKNHLMPFFSKKTIGEIRRADILEFIHSLEEVKATASKCVRLLSVAFTQAEFWGYRAENSNPCRGVPKHQDRKVERFLRNEELIKLEQVLLARHGGSKSSPYTLAAIWMLLYTGCRESEVLTLQWKDVHLEDGYIYLPDSKVGVRAIPLNEKSKQILLDLQKKEDNPYVFCGKSPGQHLQETKTTWRKVRELAGIPDVRLHDLRHSFASFALKKGVDLYTVSKLLGHKNVSTTTRYAHLELEHLKKATNKVAEIFS